LIAKESFMKTVSSTSSRTTRVRDNKRNYRTRQKEYVAELEKTVREFRTQGVEATKEVRLSAQKVLQENARLRQLLRQHGIDCNKAGTAISKTPVEMKKTSTIADISPRAYLTRATLKAVRHHYYENRDIPLVRLC
jgi:Zn-dependent oligopeptidase